MSFGPPRRNGQRPSRTEKSANHDLERKQEKLRQIAQDRQSAWILRKDLDTSSTSLRPHRATTSNSFHLPTHANNSAGSPPADLKEAICPYLRSSGRRKAWGDSCQSNVGEKLVGELSAAERDELCHLADLAVYTAKSDAYHPGRVDRPESHFCRQCSKLMSLAGHNAMCLVPCAHTLCESCASKAQQQCPICSLAVRTSTFNVLLQKIIDRFSEEQGLVKDATSHNYSEGITDQVHVLEEFVGNADYVPSAPTINRWAEQLASVEMRLSVVDVQARELAKELVNYKTRVQSHLTEVQKAEGEEDRLTKQIASLSDELEVLRKQKEKRMDGLRLERANEEKIREQLNLTNYTKAGLEAEVEKLRLLCNRKS